VFDVALSVTALFLLTPILACIATIIKARLGSPILFQQERPGLNGNIFTIYKFRTMTNERDKNGNLLPESLRLTRLGRFLRASSLDELPELLNVLKGDMSIVGPRPLKIDYLPLYTKEQARRHDMRPGITGWSQVNGRNELEWEKRFKLDNWYVKNISFRLDIRIIHLTLLKIFKKEGISPEGGDSILPPFQGNKTN